MNNSDFKNLKIKNKTTKLILKLMLALHDNKVNIKKIKTKTTVLFLCFLICFTKTKID